MPPRFGPILHFATIGSTNTWLLDEAIAGRRGPGTVAVAGEQTAGRGRLGRSWVAPTGSALLCSVLLDPPRSHPALGVERWPWLATAMGLALLERDGASRRLALKWPNDVVVDDPNSPAGYRKIAGVLAEVRQGFAVIGMGVNVSRPLDVAPEAAGGCWLDELSDERFALEEGVGAPEAGRIVGVLRGVLGAYDVLLGQLAEGGPESVRARAGQRSATIGREVRIERQGGETITGRAHDLDPAGGLVVQLPAGALMTVATGDVVHLRPV